MSHILSLALLVVMGLLATASAVLAQSDEELRQMYFQREYDRLEQIARTGDARAEAWMGLISRHRAKYDEAKRWYERAAQQGSLWAIGSLADIHFQDKEYELAVYWRRQGAEFGSSSDQLTLCQMILRGQGTARDEREAFKWCRQSVKQNYMHAYLPLARLYETGAGTEQNLAEAFMLATRAETIFSHESAGEGTVAAAQEMKSRLAPQLSNKERALAASGAGGDGAGPQIMFFLAIVAVGLIGTGAAIFIASRLFKGPWGNR